MTAVYIQDLNTYRALQLTLKEDPHTIIIHPDTFNDQHGADIYVYIFKEYIMIYTALI